MIQHDVRRLDRLISDISDASRLDAELQRGEMAPVDLAKLLNTVVAVQNETQADRCGEGLASTFEGGGPRAFMVPGHDSRLGQVINNLIDNARSFAPPDGDGARHLPAGSRDEVEIVVDDDGPGIRPEAFDKIFERFYTDRPQQGFGQNSGLGLSISKQIIEAHRGRLWAENRTAVAASQDDEPPRCSARASRCGCRPCDDRHPYDPCLRRAGRRARRADPGPVRLRQVAAGAGAAERGRPGAAAVRAARRRRPRPCRSRARPAAGARPRRRSPA